MKTNQQDIESYKKAAEQLQKIFYSVIMVVWIILLFAFGFDQQYRCNQQFWLLFSISTFILCIVELYIGSLLLYVIHSYWRDQQGVQNIYDGLQKITMDELINRQGQISSLIVVGCISAATMLFWDYQAYAYGSQMICIQITSLSDLAVIVGLFFVQYQLPSICIYYVYYRKNRKYFNSHDGEFNQNIANFYDDRSEIPLVDM